MTFLKSSFVILGLAFASPGFAVEMGDDGLHKQPWFEDTFLDMQEDLADAAAEGKDLLLLFEQRGCPYCKELHEVNFERAEITDYIQDNYYVVQLNLWGDREVTDFDGEVMSERDLAKKWFIQFTPTTAMYTLDNGVPESFADAEAMRLPGYFKPFHYMTALEYVVSDSYQTGGFQKFLQARADRMRAEGLEVDIWN
ncbi:MAG TPA: thioredoxin [Aliiroseovarius sp.]|nr:thioredoxin [Aliiroseovarius sp.]